MMNADVIVTMYVAIDDMLWAMNIQDGSGGCPAVSS